MVGLSAGVRAEALEPRRLLSGLPLTGALQVNFQPGDATSPAGFVVDAGEAFAERGDLFGDRALGWDGATSSASTASGFGAAYDTFIAGERWEVAVADGTYLVRVVTRDGGTVLGVEGRTATSAGDDAVAFGEVFAEADVEDGRLTVTLPGGGALAFVEIRPSDGSAAGRLQRAAAFGIGRTAAGLADLDTDRYLDATTKPDGTWRDTSANAWTAGFTPGVIGAVADATDDAAWQARLATWAEALVDSSPKPEDVGYRMMPGIVPLHARLVAEGETAAAALLADRIMAAAATKDARWNEAAASYHTDWRDSNSGDPRATHAILIDQTYDMTVLLWAADHTDDPAYAAELRRRVALHAETTDRVALRPDGSVSQFTYLDATNGDFVSHETAQGFADDTTWSRGQAWGILSFASLAGSTGNAAMATSAARMARYWIDRLPGGAVPWWDFDHPDAPDTFEDSSAAAIATRGLLELASLDPALLASAEVDVDEPAAWHDLALATLDTLASDTYLAVDGPEASVLRHGTHFATKPHRTDIGLVYGDFYFLDALNQLDALDHDAIAPLAEIDPFDFEQTRSLTVTFSESVVRDDGTFVLRDVAGEPSTPADVQWLDDRRAIVSLPAEVGNGDYRLDVAGVTDRAGNVLVPTTRDFFVLAGDLDRDRDVDLTDAALLERNFGRTDDPLFSEGDLDYDGDVDLIDAALLERNFGANLGTGLGTGLPRLVAPQPMMRGPRLFADGPTVRGRLAAGLFDA
ncbi:MAG: Ig-like domain-containing protein [Planctomycetota bacterium]